MQQPMKGEEMMFATSSVAPFALEKSAPECQKDFHLWKTTFGSNPISADPGVVAVFRDTTSTGGNASCAILEKKIIYCK